MICVYWIQGNKASVEIEELLQVIDGFWIDKDGNVANEETGNYFVMPHQIDYVRKESYIPKKK